MLKGLQSPNARDRIKKIQKAIQEVEYKLAIMKTLIAWSCGLSVRERMYFLCRVGVSSKCPEG